jgi:hypothetical protein
MMAYGKGKGGYGMSASKKASILKMAGKKKPVKKK